MAQGLRAIRRRAQSRSSRPAPIHSRSEEHTSELQSYVNLVCRLLLEKKNEPIITPSVVQRFDFHPQLEIPLDFDGWTLTTTLGGRATYYSNSIDPVTKLILSRDVVRGYGELELELRPPALARNFHRSDGSVTFRHVIESYVIYRRIGGLDNFDRIIRFDYVDAVANTNEIEFGLANRFFTRRSTETVTRSEEHTSELQSHVNLV